MQTKAITCIKRQLHTSFKQKDILIWVPFGSLINKECDSVNHLKNSFPSRGVLSNICG